MYPPFPCARGGFAQHITQRGTHRAPCFSGAPDCRLYLGLLARHAPGFDCRVHAYALMGNHVHLLLTASGRAGAGDMLRVVRDGYTRGAMEADFASSLIHSARHLLACMRYIELNPVRAGIVRRPGDYRWSSYAANALGREDALISPHPHYLALGRDPALRCTVYRGSVEETLRRKPPSGTTTT